MLIQFSPNCKLEFELPPELEGLREAPEGREKLWQKLSLGDFAAAEVRVVNTPEVLTHLYCLARRCLRGSKAYGPCGARRL